MPSLTIYPFVPDCWSRYKIAATISHKVLEEVTKWLVDGEKIVELCQKGDKLLEDELSKGKFSLHYSAAGVQCLVHHRKPPCAEAGMQQSLSLLG